MRFSQRTIAILKNFATIEQSMIFHEGSTLATKNEKVFARAKIDESIPVEFGVDKLSQFLAVLGLFTEPDVEIADESVVIRSGKESIAFQCVDTRFIDGPKKDAKVNFTPVTGFTVTNEQLSKLLKAQSVIVASHICIKADGENITLEALVVPRGNIESTSSVYKAVIGKTDMMFKLVFTCDSFRFMPGLDYKVELSANKLARFSSSGVEYFLAAESKFSSFT